MIIQKDTCSPVSGAALCTRAKTVKQPTCSSTEEWIKKMWHIIYNGVLPSHKKGWDNATCSTMDEPRDDHMKWSQGKTNTIGYHLYKPQMNLFTKQKQTHRHRKQTYDYYSGKEGEGQIRPLGLTYITCCCSVAKWCPTLCDPMDCSTPGSSVLHCLLEFAQIHSRWAGDAI